MNQQDMYGGYEPEIDLKDLLFFILYRWRKILLTAAIFCVLLSVFGGIRRMSADPDAEPKKIREYRQELAQYELDLTSLEQDMANYQERLAQQETYMEESVLMRTDPYSKPTASVDIFVKMDDTEWEILPDNINVDPTDSLLKMYTSSFAASLDWSPIEELTGGKELYLRELVSVSVDYNSNAFSISVVYSDAETAQQILYIVLAQVMEKQQDLTDGISKHTISVANQSLAYSIDASLADSQKRNADALTEYGQAILDCQKKLDELEEGMPKEPVVIGFIKYPAAGFLAGGFLAVFFFGAAYLLGGRLHGEGELKDRFGYPLLGVYPCPEKGGFLPTVDRFLDKMSGASGKSGTDEAIQRIAVNITNLANGKKSLLVTGTAGIGKLQGLLPEITPLLKGIALTAATDMNRDARTLELLAGCDGVILVEEKDKSLISGIQKEQESIRALGKPVIGYMLL